jgi:hypothetical protein
MLFVGAFSPEVRREEKIRSRERDQLRLSAGQVSASNLAQQNCMVSGLDPSRAKIVHRRVAVDLSACRQMGG